MNDITATPPIELSESAARRILSILADEAPGAIFRIGVDGGGCSGFQYTFAIAESVADDDMILERDGARVAIDQVSAPFLTGAKIDFVDDLMGQSFRIANPNATASCGCGTSFSV